jgi:hypothetical protein
VTGDKYAFPLSQQVTDEISNGVGFPRTGRSLDQDSAGVLDAASNPNLLWVCGLGQEDVGIL